MEKKITYYKSRLNIKYIKQLYNLNILIIITKYI